MPGMQVQALFDENAAAAEAAEVIAVHAREAVGARGRFVAALSGGGTPWKMVRILAEKDLPWDKIWLAQVDERVAPEGHPDRNLTQLRECLAAAPLPAAHILAMPVDAENLEEAAERYTTRLSELCGTPPVLDLVHLGLGTDGHTASLVPGDPVLDVEERDVAITGVYQGWRRMTLTYPVINRARQILWLVTGSAKAEMLRRTSIDHDDSIPAGRVRRDAVLVLTDKQCWRATKTGMFTSKASRDLRQSIADKSAVVGVIGLGYVGLPLVRAFVQAGFRTLGFDVDPEKVRRLEAGQSYIRHIPSETIAAWLEAGRFQPTCDMRRLAEPDALLICVPTPLTDSRDPDLSFVEATARQIAAALRPGQLVVLESTTYPGTTRDVVLPILAGAGLESGSDYFLAYSPEREDPGNPSFTAQSIPKVVGGMDPASLQLANLLYSQAVVRTVPVASCETAEACKILENTYRAVNIALVNELKVLFASLGIDVWDVIEAAKTKPFGFQPFYPGPGLGGHCIPIDPFYLSWLARKHELPTRFIELAGEINSGMPRYVVDRVAEALNDAGKPVRGSRIGILGVAYKKDVDDPRESPAFKLMELLEARGAILSYNDPYIPVLPEMRHSNPPRLSSEPLTAEYLASQDCLLIATDHTAYDWPFIVRHARLVIDTRNATREVSEGREKICKA
jgi:UDP-N-acetyl-D-glucosamine dehydrogenase